MKMYLILIIIFFANGYTCCAGDIFNYATRRNLSRYITGVVLFSLAGSLILLFATLFTVVINFITWLDRLIQLKFYWRLYISKTYQHLTNEQLETMNLNAKMYFGSLRNANKKLNILDWHFLHTCKVLKKFYYRTDMFKWVDNKDNFIRKKN